VRRLRLRLAFWRVVLAFVRRRHDEAVADLCWRLSRPEREG
jgi:hypothetical protein